MGAYCNWTFLTFQSCKEIPSLQPGHAVAHLVTHLAVHEVIPLILLFIQTDPKVFNLPSETTENYCPTLILK